MFATVGFFRGHEKALFAFASAPFIVLAIVLALPALLLARVDGKSPVEYLDDPDRQQARALALDLMRHPAGSISEVFAR